MTQENSETLARLFGIPNSDAAQQAALTTLARTVATSKQSPEEAVPQEVQHALGSPENIVGRYVLVDKSGKAFDVELLRYVAIKFIDEKQYNEISGKIRRIAGLEHQNILRLYDVQRYYGKCFMTSQYVEARGLSEIPYDQMRLARCFIEVCDGLSYAHSSGIIHGNLSTDSILVDSDDNVYLTGFGFAPFNSAVETDLKALSAVMDLQLPQNDEPGNDELRAIISKSFSAASEISADLENFCGGLPVRAYGDGITYRARKLFGRNKHLFVGAIVAAAITGLLLIFLLAKTTEGEAAEKNREKAAAESQKKSEEGMRLVSAVLSDLSKSHEEALQRRKAGESYPNLLQIATRTIGSRVYRLVRDEGFIDVTVRHSLGKLYRIIGAYDNAMKEQMEAVKLDPSHPGARYELGVLHRRLYSDKLSRLRLTWRAGEYEKYFRNSDNSESIRIPADPSNQDLEESNEELRKEKEISQENLRRALSSLDANSCDALAAEAVIALFAGENSKAEHLLRRALDKESSHEDSVIFLVEMLELSSRWQEALSVLGKAIGLDKGNTFFLEKRISVSSTMGNGLLTTDESPMKYYNQALEDCGRLCRLRPDDAGPLIDTASQHVNIGVHLTAVNQNPMREYNLAAECYGKALALAGPTGRDEFDLYIGRGMVWVNMGEYLKRSGEDEETYFEKAIADFDRATKMRPDYHLGWLRRGDQYHARGVYRLRLGKDPENDFKSAEADLTRAVELGAREYYAWMMRGVLKFSVASWKAKRGQSPVKEFSDGVHDLGIAISLNENDYESRMWRGNLWENAAQFKCETGLDPRKEFEMGLADLDKAIGLRKDFPVLYMMRGMHHSNLGGFLERTGNDPTGEYKAGIADIDLALSLSAKHDRVWFGRGTLYNNWGSYVSSAGNDASELFKKAIDSYAEAIEINPSNFESHHARGTAFNNLAICEKRKNGDPIPMYKEAAQEFAEALYLNPTNSDIYTDCGNLVYNWAHFDEKAGVDPAVHYKHALADYARAAELNPANADAWVCLADAKGSFLSAILQGRCSEKVDSAALYAEILEDFDRALKINPGNGEAFMRRATCHFTMGKYDAAIRDFERGAKLNPNLVQPFKSVWEKAKKAVENDY